MGLCPIRYSPSHQAHGHSKLCSQWRRWRGGRRRQPVTYTYSYAYTNANIHTYPDTFGYPPNCNADYFNSGAHGYAHPIAVPDSSSHTFSNTCNLGYTCTGVNHPGGAGTYTSIKYCSHSFPKLASRGSADPA